MARRRTSASGNVADWTPIQYHLSVSQPPVVERHSLETVAEEWHIPAEKREEFFGELEAVAVAYGAALHQRAKPSDAMHAADSAPVMKAAKRLSQKVQELSSFSALALRFPVIRHGPMELPAVHNYPPLQDYLQAFIGACERSMRKGQAGAPPRSHITQATASLARIWSKYNDGKRFPRSLEIVKGKVLPTGEYHKEFGWDPARLVFIAMRALVPEVKIAAVQTGLRASSGRRRKKRSSPETG